MINDPKQIVTPFAFEVHPDLLGLPLASPRRRLLALLLDLLIASILTALGAFFLATAASILFFWLAIRTRGKVWWKNIFRYGGAVFVSILVFALTLNVTKDGEDFDSGLVTFNTLDGEVVQDSTGNVDWSSFAKQVGQLSKNDSLTIEEQLEGIALNLENQLKKTSDTPDALPSELFENEFVVDLRSLGIAISRNDTIAIDSLRDQVAPILASIELAEKDFRIDRLDERVDKLEEKNEELTEQVENPSFLRSMKATAEDFGLSVGWIGVYFVLCTAFFKGQTLGKRLLSLRVVRLNNKPVGLLYSFERFGGYAAGIATGLLGFAQIFWDANRQAIHDKIAATVVLDTRKKTIQKYEELRKKILSDENLLE